MLHIICNGKPVQLPDGIGLQDAANQLQPTASVTIRNGFQTSENCILADGDSITLIEKGVLPPRDVLEHMMAARHSPKVHETVRRARVGIAGLGGLYYVMDYACGVWSNDAFGDRGWLAIALAIFAIWRPNLDILASILFGGLYILYLYMPTGMDHMEYKELYKMIPYIVTLAVLVITSMRNKRENQPPASLGLSYFREER